MKERFELEKKGMKEYQLEERRRRRKTVRQSERKAMKIGEQRDTGQQRRKILSKVI